MLDMAAAFGKSKTGFGVFLRTKIKLGTAGKVKTGMERFDD
jgi:hypothetical protein